MRLSRWILALTLAFAAPSAILSPLLALGETPDCSRVEKSYQDLGRSKNTVTTFSESEEKAIQEVIADLKSPEIAKIRAAHIDQESITVMIGDRLIQYEPGLPASGMTMFGENGFLIGRDAFASEEEFIKTLLHETHRLTTSEIGKGTLAAGADQVTHETQAAFGFAERAYPLVRIWLDGLKK